MLKNGLLLPRKYLLNISILGFIIILVGALLRITHMSFFGINGRILIVIGSILSLFSWVFVLIDVIRNRPQNWILWIFFLFVSAHITAIIYLFKKKNLKANKLLKSPYKNHYNSNDYKLNFFMNSSLLIPKNILFPIAFIGLLFTVFSVTIDLSSLGLPIETSKLLIYVGMACNFITVIVLIVDVFKNNLSSKYLWTLAFLLSGCFAGLYYLINREKYFSPS